MTRRVRRMAVTVLARPLLREGFVRPAARLWVRELYRDWQNPMGGRHLLRAAHRAGFDTATYALAVSESDKDAVISQREFHQLYRLNRPRLGLSNRVIAALRLPGLAARMETPIASFSFFRGTAPSACSTTRRAKTRCRCRSCCTLSAIAARCASSRSARVPGATTSSPGWVNDSSSTVLR
ncbi:hypothetical protein [Microbacterium sp. NIBRBAC000506063]|uniref:hypothetical protein n=1 Tax=Microbacterium sp. NIBRBAC000506063 TaxID=2734618 RepID=UPI001BB6FB9E|nr:hypothetical protein [Microbacterium sp. NIBRBAC000506063]QTV80559.1 hypothetical protein KAE78_06810 [Microbacterium sp. NIBRBAC000506063]